MIRRPGSDTLLLMLTLATAAGCARHPAPTAPVPGRGNAEVAAAPGDSSAPPRAPASPGQPRPYNRVITSAAVTKVGLFKTHMIGEKLFFEIPRSELNRELLVISRTVEGGATSGFFGGGMNRVVVWQRDGNRILLRQRAHAIVADSTTAIYRAVAAMNAGPIIASFNIEAWGPDSTAVIDVSRLYTTNINEFAAVTGVAGDRSYVNSVEAFPRNINVEATQTGTQSPPPGAPPGARGTTMTARQMWSMLKLPEVPMRPRLADKRVGILSVSMVDYSRPEHEALRRTFVRRFRLEKQDPGAAVSDPVEPIVFWIDPATPEWLVPWVKRGIEDWEPAYRAAGFSNAIVAREAPTPTEDPTWSPFDVRHNIIYWRPSEVANATGGQVVDPRTGEILKAEVNMYHNVMDLLRDWYFTQVSPLDVRTQRLPLPDSLMGRLVEYVVAHEVGHAIGFPHNMKASSQYPADSLRSAAFLRRMGGHVATLMDYSRFNYVAQPEDSIPPELLVPGVGPYDVFAIRWQNEPIPGARTPDDELPTLDRWARQQDTVPWFRFSTIDATGDPGDITEAVGDSDAVRSSALGLRNLERVASSLLRVAEQPGRDYTLLTDLYGNVVSQWSRYNGHVAAIIAGAETQERYGTGIRFTPVSEARQREAMRFLHENAFRVPPYLLDPELLFRMEQEGTLNRIRAAQAGVLNTLFAPSRLNRLVEYEALARGTERAYTLAEMLADLRRGVWTELTTGRPRIDPYRRNLQRSYLEAVGRIVNPPAPPAPTTPGTPVPVIQLQQARPTGDARAVLRGELQELDRAAAAAIGRTSDAMTRLHLRDVRMEIDRILDPRR
ncbi:MAG TPA: zinc-dependent metalloprotease [Longimicrobiales bacterium]|nr:zinc-dependent metalloprotease [Longimicrobiales bacterium]